MEFRKTVRITLYAREQKRHRFCLFRFASRNWVGVGRVGGFEWRVGRWEGIVHRTWTGDSFHI